MSETERSVLKASGKDVHDFLQGLVTNDVPKSPGQIAYAALLTPQGKFIVDFFLVCRDDCILIDVAREQAAMLFQRLSLYKLRADVSLEQTDLTVSRGLGTPPDGAMTDPRAPEMGWRGYDGQLSDTVDWDAQRVSARVPLSGAELTADSYILEMGFERLNGVDFRKGCYVGQEVTARMKHKTELRKGLAVVRVDGPATSGDEITANGKSVGTIATRAGDTALAYVRFDRATDDMRAGEARVNLIQ